MDELLKSALTPMDVPDEKLNNQILLKTKERDFMKNKYQKKKFSVAACVAACVLVMSSVTAVAAYRYLNPKDVAAELDNHKLEQAFQSENALYVNETQEGGGYRVTLLGSVAGENISDFLPQDEQTVVEKDKIYTVLAIEHVDGTPMPDTSSEEYGEETFLASHYVQGLNPMEYNIMSMGGGGYSEFVRDGIQYRLIEMNNIDMFADKEIYVGINTGTFYDVNAYYFDAVTGKITRNEGYEGLNALFILPIDKNKANPDAAKAFLENMSESKYLDDDMEMNAADLSVEEFIEKLETEKITDYAKPIESTRQICAANEDGRILLSYELESGAGGPKWGITIDSDKWKENVLEFWKKHKEDDNRDFIAGYCVHILTEQYKDKESYEISEYQYCSKEVILTFIDECVEMF